MFLWIAAQVFTANSLIAQRSDSTIGMRNVPSIYWSTELYANLKNRARLIFHIPNSDELLSRATSFVARVRCDHQKYYESVRPLALRMNCFLPVPQSLDFYRRNYSIPILVLRGKKSEIFCRIDLKSLYSCAFCCGRVKARNITGRASNRWRYRKTHNIF